jgi:hypothetical protein
MNLSQKEFQAQIKEDQELILQVLADNEEVSFEKFYKVAGFLEYLNLFSGILYSVIESNSKKK